MNRKQQQAELLFSLGELFGPLLRIAQNPSPCDGEEATKVIARFVHDSGRFEGAVTKFTRGEPGHDYSAHTTGIQINLVQLRKLFRNRAVIDPEFLTGVASAKDRIQEAILSIPITMDSTICEPKSQFATYCQIKDLCLTAQKRIVWTDRYFDHTVFHRYLRGLPDSVAVTLVILPESKLKGAKDERRFREFMDISKLYAQELGPTKYRLLTDETFHARRLLCDGQIIVFDNSVKDIDRDFAITQLDATPGNTKWFDDIVAAGKELFGPSQPVHP